MTAVRTKPQNPEQAEFALRRLLAEDAKIARARARRDDNLMDGAGRRDQTRRKRRLPREADPSLW
jgi:hypothetical protein